MKFKELAEEINVSVQSIEQFIQDFGLNVGECICDNFDVQDDFVRFAKDNSGFLLDYENDLEQNKSIDDIAKKIKKPKDKIQEVLNRENPVVLDNGMYKSSVSSYSIDNKLGGNYRFVYDYFGNKTLLTKKDFIGYADLFFYITDVLEPFIDDKEAKNWGIQKPAGIVLYGPPGSGKIFWAHKIASIIGYDVDVVKRHYFGSAYVHGNHFTFNDFLVSMLKTGKVELLMEDFDTIMTVADESCTEEDMEMKDIVMNHIHHFQEENLLMIGLANTISTIDKEVLAPGRFDVLVPIFPPNAKERAEIIVFSLLKNLSDDALLRKILHLNGADKVSFWMEVASQMRAYSNTMVIDFTQSLKIQIRNQFKKSQNQNLEINDTIIDIALRDSAAKLTAEYLSQVQQFVNDVALNNSDDFQVRLFALQAELDTYKIKEEPERPIGFHKNEDEDESKS